MKKIVFGILLGIACGLVMSILVLYMMISGVLTFASAAFFLSVIAASALPLCLNAVKSESVSMFAAQIAMIVTSYVITLIYGAYIAHSAALIALYDNVFGRVAGLSSIIHGVALAVCLITAGIYYIYDKKGQA